MSVRHPKGDAAYGIGLALRYDTLSRLTSGTPAAGNNVTGGLNLCWSYDAFGNRTAQSEQSSACPSTETSLTPTASYNGNNQVTFVANVAPAGYGYDGAGDVGNDNVNQYLYDGDGRICAVANTPVPGMTTMTGYIYDGDGSRVAKGKITAWSCDPSINGFEPNTEHDYILGLSGEQVTEMAASGSSMVWQHTNVWAGGKLIATYDSTGKGLHFYLNDPLGTRRAQTDYAGNWEQSCSSLPYGDGLTCSDSANGPTEHQFTSKQYDSESGNYFFEARYYNPGVARFLSPDWSAQEEPVPYAKLDNPQTLNLYSYMRNNPLSGTDPDGHSPDWWQKFWNGLAGYGKVTDTERDARIEEQRQWLISKFAGDDATKDYFENASGKAIFAAYGCAQSASCLQNAISAGQVILSAVAVTFGDGKLAHIYDKHAGDFGLSGDKNTQQLQKLDQAIQEYVNDPDTKLIEGQYRGQDANLYYNSRTQNVVVTDKSNNVIAGFKARGAQVNYINTTGRLN